MISTRNTIRLSAAMLAMTSLAACGGDKTTETTTETTAATTTEATAPAVESAAETASAATDAAASTATAAVGAVTYASLTGDATKGEKVFAVCKTCHVAEAGVNRVGPSLWGVVGRKAGTIPNFKYSPANKNSGLIWTEEQLFTYLEAPQKVVKGTYMAYAGLKPAQDRADLIAYLKTRA